MGVLKKLALPMLLALLALAVLYSTAEGRSGQIERDCTLTDTNILQQVAADGSFLVAVNNACFNRKCQAWNVQVQCADYAPTWKVPAWDVFTRIPDTDTCTVNNNQPISDLVSFSYSQDRMASLSVSHVEFVCT